MKTLETLSPIRPHLEEIQHLSSAASLLSWDQETYMPEGGGSARADQLATVQGLAHDRLVSSDVESLLAQWIDLDTGSVKDPDSWNEPARAFLREIWQDFSKARKLPSDFVKRLGRECSIAQQVWAGARAHSQFKKFLPSLRTIVSLKQEEANYLGFSESPYDALLDTYEPGATIATLRPLFASLKARLVPLLQQIQQSSVQIDDAILFRSYDQQRQVEFGKLVLTAMGYDFTKGRLDLSEHPFTTSFHPSDVRVTSRVFEHDLPSCLFSCIHEGGHGLYEQGLDPTLFGTPLGEARSLGIHESQSRLWENCIGRSKPFWTCFFPTLQQIFPTQLGSFSFDHFFSAINRVQPSLIRVEADELTYNLHIMLRFEIEQDLIEGHARVEDLPDIWNAKVKDYLGLVPERDAEGVLQDVHWSLGAFGYFPTYTLGNLYSVQFFNQARQEIVDFDATIEKGQLVTLTRWLNQKIHRWGRTFTAEHLAQRVTGSSLTPEPFLTYLEEKFGALYQLNK